MMVTIDENLLVLVIAGSVALSLIFGFWAGHMAAQDKINLAVIMAPILAALATIITFSAVAVGFAEGVG